MPVPAIKPKGVISSVPSRLAPKLFTNNRPKQITLGKGSCRKMGKQIRAAPGALTNGHGQADKVCRFGVWKDIHLTYSSRSR